jgi:hypothetical protein
VDPAPPPLIIDDEEEYEVETLLARREKETSSKKSKHGKKKRIRIEYLVKWSGYGPEHNQWIPEAELTRHCGELLREFAARQKSS